MTMLSFMAQGTQTCDLSVLRWENCPGLKAQGCHKGIEVSKRVRIGDLTTATELKLM